MKMRLIWITLPAFALCFGACKKKEESPEANKPEPSVPGDGGQTVQPDVPEVQKLTAAQRAEFLGFAQHMPKETEVVMSMLNGSETVKRVLGSQLWMSIAGDTTNPKEMMQVIDDGPAGLFTREFTIAVGDTTDEQTSNLLQLNRRYNYISTRAMVREFAANSGDISAMNGFTDEMFDELANDPEGGVALYEKMKMPPVYVAFKTTEENRDKAFQQVAQTTDIMTFLDEMVVEVEVAVNGSTFTGYKLQGAKIAEELEDGREKIQETLTEENMDRFIAATAKKDLVMLSGIVGDYVVLFIGSSEDDLKFAPSVEDSLLATDAMAFCDAYASKQMAGVIYGEDAALSEMMTHAKSGLADLAAGFRDGLSGSEGLGNTRDLEALLRMVQDREKALYDLYKVSGGGTVAFFEDGLKIESFGGFDSGGCDWEVDNRLASLGDDDGVLLFANMTWDVAYDARLREYMEALLETAYMATMKFSEVSVTSDELIEFKNYTTLFDTKFRVHLLTFWEGFSGGFSGGLGHERAWVMDLNGSMPAIPGVPQAVVDEAKFPRLSIVAPVVDRSKLSEAWKKMDEGLTGILANVSEMMGSEIPMQKPVTSEKEGYKTFFFAMPFFNDDFMPSVTVGDEWFVASTSKTRALSLVDAAEAEGKTRKGAYFALDFKALDLYADETIALMQKHREEIGVSERDLSQMETFAKALDDLDKLTAYVRRENGQLRSSIHFKTR